MKHLVFVVAILFLLGCNAERGGYAGEHPAWEEEYAGVWKAVIGRPDATNLLNAAQILPKGSALNRLGNVNFSG